MTNSDLPLGSLTANIHAQLMLSIGIIVVALLDGVLLTLGFACLLLLSPPPPTQPKSSQSLWLRIYVVVLLLSNFGYEAAFFIWNNLPNILGRDNPQMSKISNILVFVGKLTPTLLIGLTDGLLVILFLSDSEPPVPDVVKVWRCYNVHKALGPNESRISNLCWIIPLCLWLITAITCIIGGAMIENTRLSTAASGIQATGYVSNIILNVFATIYLCNRLLHHRRLVKNYFGPETPTQRHVRIVSALLESAAINIPITIAGAIGIGTAELFGLIVVTVAITCQSLASLIVILLIALGRAIEQRGDIETEATRGSRSQGYDLSIPVPDSVNQTILSP